MKKLKKYQNLKQKKKKDFFGKELIQLDMLTGQKRKSGNFRI